MADRQIEEVLPQIMSLADYDEQRFYRMSDVSSERTASLISGASNSDDILNDSQDRIEETDDINKALTDNVKDFILSYNK